MPLIKSTIPAIIAKNNIPASIINFCLISCLETSSVSLDVLRKTLILSVTLSANLSGILAEALILSVTLSANLSVTLPAIPLADISGKFCDQLK